MIEFDETLSTVYSQKQALLNRIYTRLKHTTKDIPYYNRGVDITEFTYGSKTAAIKLAFRDLGPMVSYDDKNSRIQYYNINVDVGSLGE